MRRSSRRAVEAVRWAAALLGAAVAASAEERDPRDPWSRVQPVELNPLPLETTATETQSDEPTEIRDGAMGDAPSPHTPPAAATVVPVTAPGPDAAPASAGTGDATGRRLLNRTPAAGTAKREGAAPRAESSWVRSIGSLAGVVALIFLLAWGYRVVAAGGRMRMARGRHPELLEVVARTAVSARQSLCLVRVGPRLVLVGVGPERLTALDVVTDADTTARLAGQAAQARGTSHTAEFERCLEREAKAYGEPAATPDVSTPDEARVSAIKRTLQAAAARLQAAAAARS